jgi:hypothetical protein
VLGGYERAAGRRRARCRRSRAGKSEQGAGPTAATSVAACPIYSASFATSDSLFFLSRMDGLAGQIGTVREAALLMWPSR